MERLLFETRQPAQLDAVRELRHLLEQVIQASVPHQSMRRRMLLCLSEAVTNLLLHGTSALGNIGLGFGRNSQGWWLEIEDDGTPWDPTTHNKTNVLSQFESIENGRGIALLHSQCDQMKYQGGDSTKPNRLHLSWSAPGRGECPTILLVEDDDSLRRLYAAFLADSFNVQTATNGHDALQQLNAGGIDLVLSDIRMPKMDGLGLRETLNSEQETELTPFIFLTAADDASIQQHATSLGVDDYLIKPIKKRQLICSIERVLERSRQIHRQLTDRIERRITASLAPSLPETSHGWRLAVANRHTGSGGGDFLLHQSNEDQLMVTLADIMGHDDSAKFFAFAYAGYLRGLMQTSGAEISPAKMLERLSADALQDALLSQMILTCCTASLSAGGCLTLACAGHPAPLRISSAGVETLPVTGTLPGLLPATQYRSLSLKIRPGERIALYTDGLFESAKDTAGRRELEARITETLSDTIEQPLEHSLENTMRLFDQIAGSPPQDDALLLLLEPAEWPVHCQ